MLVLVLVLVLLVSMSSPPYLVGWAHDDVPDEDDDDDDDSIRYVFRTVASVTAPTSAARTPLRPTWHRLLLVVAAAAAAMVTKTKRARADRCVRQLQRRWRTVRVVVRTSGCL